jgi:Flp pilus assembly protein TadD
VRAWTRLGLVLARQGELDAAHEVLVRTARAHPDDAEVHERLAIVAELRQDPHTAVIHFRAALRLAPGLRHARRRLGWILATSPDPDLRDGAEAVRHYTRACEETGYRDLDDLDGLAVAYAEAGRFEDAVRTARWASALAREMGLESRAHLSDRRAERYGRGETLVSGPE